MSRARPQSLSRLALPTAAIAHAIQEALTIRRELTARWPDTYGHELEQSFQVAAWLEHGEDFSDASRGNLRCDNGPLSPRCAVNPA